MVTVYVSAALMPPQYAISFSDVGAWDLLRIIIRAPVRHGIGGRSRERAYSISSFSRFFIGLSHSESGNILACSSSSDFSRYTRAWSGLFVS